MDIFVPQVIKLIWLMLRNALLRIKKHAMKTMDPSVILLDLRHGAMLITQMVNCARHKMELIALILHLVGM
jgi:hypothetical protein